MKSKPQTLGELAKLDRKSKGMTQIQYAKANGLHTSTAVSLYEAGKRRVPPQVVEVIIDSRLPEYKKCSKCSGTGIVKENRANVIEYEMVGT